MNIALLFPKSTFLTDPLVWPPLGLFYIAAQLEAQGHTTEFFDMSLKDYIPKDGDFDQLWISATAPQMFEVRKIANITKKWQKTKTVLGGAAPWANPETSWNLGFDLIVAGEGDHPHTIKRILDEAEKKKNSAYFVPLQKDLDWVLPPIRRWSKNYHAYMSDMDGNEYRMTTLFTSRGCPMECAFCIEENQLVLMSDWSLKAIKDVQIGDYVMSYHKGEEKDRNQGFIAPTRVLNKFDNGIRETIEISDSQSSLQLTPDHKIYAYDGHKTRWKRADSITLNKYKFRKFNPMSNIQKTREFKRGWLHGYIAGDGCIHLRNGKTNITVTSRDENILDLFIEWAEDFFCEFRKFKHQMGNSIFPTKKDSKYIDAIQCTSGFESDNFLARIRPYAHPSNIYCAGWLAGIYDSDGSLDSGGNCRIFQSEQVNPHYVKLIRLYLAQLNIPYNLQYREKDQAVFIINQYEFLSKCRPIMKRKYPEYFGYKSLEQTEVTKIEKTGKAHVYDLETESHNYIAQGFIVHNCESGRHGIIWDALTRYEPLDIVEYQIKESQELGFTGLAYYDDIFIVNRKRTYQLLDLNRKYNMKWRCFLRSDILCKHGGKDYLKDMKDSGLIEVFVGVESADNEIKKNIHKGTTIEQDTQVLDWCKELGIRCKMSFIFGLPGESLESMQKTKDWIFKHQPHIVQTDRLIPFPGTPLTKNIEEYDLKYEEAIEDEWFFRGRYDINSKSFVSTSNLTRDEIDEFWHKMEEELLEKGLSGYGH